VGDVHPQVGFAANPKEKRIVDSKVACGIGGTVMMVIAIGSFMNGAFFPAGLIFAGLGVLLFGGAAKEA